MLRFFLAVLFIAYSLYSEANTVFTDAKTLRAQADTFAKAYFINQNPNLTLNENLFVHTGRLDSRLKLPKCDKPLHMHVKSHAHSLSNATINVSCDSVKRWSIFVPVRIEVFSYAITVSKPISKGQQVTLRHLSKKRVNTVTLRGGFFTSNSEVLGQQALKTMRAGQIIKPSMLKAADAIEKGDKIIVRVEHPFLSVKVNAIALESGAVGDQIRVKNNESKKTVYATVQKSGIAIVN